MSPLSAPTRGMWTLSRFTLRLVHTRRAASLGRFLVLAWSHSFGWKDGWKDGWKHTWNVSGLVSDSPLALLFLACRYSPTAALPT